MTTPVNRPTYAVGSRVKLLSRNYVAYAAGGYDVERKITLTPNDELIISYVMDMRGTPARTDEPQAFDAEYTAYMVYALKQVPERYKAGEVSKVKHTDLLLRKDGTHSPLPYKINDRVYLKVNTETYPKGSKAIVLAFGSLSGPGGDPKSKTAKISGQVTSATPLSKIVYDADVYSTRLTQIRYIPKGTVHHDQLHQV
ncbi:hypothetical protein Clacol_002170 [Clathrus columnatus]|uniref:Uncharacterized protein n=1 Tax=Clathrus columnatus TaxID=1419009 RepID=A0AAV5A5N3_9AGAM|nr:hypothetical protein Clacol_002170 [Clathrus columnatus]